MSSRELEVYTEHKPILVEILIPSLTRLAMLAAGQRLIRNTIVANRFGQTSTQKERAKCLIEAVMGKIDKNLDAAATVMENFIECVEETVLHTFLSKQAVYTHIRLILIIIIGLAAFMRGRELSTSVVITLV